MISLFIGGAIAVAYFTHGTALFVPAVIVAIVSFWSNGVMANFRHEPDAVPRLATLGSMLSLLATIILAAVYWLAF